MSELLGPKPDTHGYYEAFAASGWYDKDTETSGWPEVADRLMARVFEYKTSESVHSALDLGAGSGLTIAALKKFTQPERLVAVDASANMLALLSQKETCQDVVGVEDSIQHFAAETKAQFDLVTAFSSLEFLPNLPSTLGDMTRLVKPDGLLAFTYAPRRSEDDPPERLIDSRGTAINNAMMEYYWTPAEIGQTLYDSDLTVIDWLDDATSMVHGCDYSFIVAQKLPAPPDQSSSA